MALNLEADNVGIVIFGNDRLIKEGDTVLVLGGAGKSGILCLYEAKKKAGKSGKVICWAHRQSSLDTIEKLG